MATDQDYLLVALDQAFLHRGQCAPNPAVGAVVVVDGEVISAGSHPGPGKPHAEVLALEGLPAERLTRATLYVTLEPCCHHGRTPPCTDLIIEKKIPRVVFASLDPNPEVAGRGQATLQQYGVECVHQPLDAVEVFYQSYRYWWQYHRPFVTLKLAMTRDGMIANADGSPYAITGEACRRLTHREREQADALMTTVRTIINDDPQLNVRIDGRVVAKPLMILDRKAQLPLQATVWKSASSITVFHGSSADPEAIHKLAMQGATCVMVAEDDRGLDLLAVLHYLGQQGVHDLWVEAGGRCFQSFVHAGLANRILCYISPERLGAGGYRAFQQFLPGDGRPVSIDWIDVGDSYRAWYCRHK